mgnify:CR=1 FL=1
MKKIGSIKNLEVSSLCNLRCPYCPARIQSLHRETGLMTEDVFAKSMEWLKVFVRNGTQKEMNIFGVGEPLLHPNFVSFVARARNAMPRYLPLIMNTNGTHMTQELAVQLKNAGIDKIDVTDHEAETAMKAIKAVRRAGIQCGYSRDAVINPNNWGGLIEWTDRVDYERYQCPWLTDGCVMIMSNGDVTRCCQDGFGRGVLGTVDDDLPSISHTPFIQCRKCHENLPPGYDHSDFSSNPKYNSEVEK